MPNKSQRRASQWRRNSMLGQVDPRRNKGPKHGAVHNANAGSDGATMQEEKAAAHLCHLTAETLLVEPELRAFLGLTPGIFGPAIRQAERAGKSRLGPEDGGYPSAVSSIATELESDPIALALRLGEFHYSPSRGGRQLSGVLDQALDDYRRAKGDLGDYYLERGSLRRRSLRDDGRRSNGIKFLTEHTIEMQKPSGKGRL